MKPNSTLTFTDDRHRWGIASFPHTLVISCGIVQAIFRPSFGPSPSDRTPPDATIEPVEAPSSWSSTLSYYFGYFNENFSAYISELPHFFIISYQIFKTKLKIGKIDASFSAYSSTEDALFLKTVHSVASRQPRNFSTALSGHWITVRLTGLHRLSSCLYDGTSNTNSWSELPSEGTFYMRS